MDMHFAVLNAMGKDGLMTDAELARQLLDTPTGCCSANAYELFYKYRKPLNSAIGPSDAEILDNLKALAKGVGWTGKKLKNFFVGGVGSDGAYAPSPKPVPKY